MAVAVVVFPHEVMAAENPNDIEARALEAKRRIDSLPIVDLENPSALQISQEAWVNNLGNLEHGLVRIMEKKRQHIRETVRVSDELHLVDRHRLLVAFLRLVDEKSFSESNFKREIVLS